MIKSIEHITDWIKADEVPTLSVPQYEEWVSEYGKFTGSKDPGGNQIHGVYQWAHKDDLEKIGEKVIHGDIGYIGTALRDIIGRTRAVTVPKGAHPIKMLLAAGDYDVDDLRVRYLFIKNAADAVNFTNGRKLETYLHDEMDKKFGYRYKWVNAQLSNDNKHNYVLKNWRELTYTQAIKILPEVIEITKQLGANHIASEVEQIVNGDYNE